MPDPITVAAAAVAVERTAKAAGLTAGAEAFFQRIGSHLGATVAEALGNVHRRREENAAATLNRAAQMAAAAGIEPRPVPLRLLAPILDGASVEDEPSMQERWAALLANATANPEGIPPLFPRILAELTPSAARTLELLAQLEARDRRATPITDATGTSFADLLDARGSSGEQGATADGVRDALAVLHVLGLIAPAKPPRWVDLNLGNLALAHLDSDSVVRLTDAAVTLLRLCREPSQMSARGQESPMSKASSTQGSSNHPTTDPEAPSKPQTDSAQDSSAAAILRPRSTARASRMAGFPDVLCRLDPPPDYGPKKPGE